MEAYVYTMIDESTLNELLGALHVCIDLPVQLLDENGRILKYFGKKNTYCQHFSSHFSSEKTCMHIHSNAGKRAMNLGSSYIFSCQSNLSHIVFPLINHESLFGSILIGPFLMERADSTLISRLLYFLMSSLISDSREQFIINQKKLHQQARISESIQMYKTMEPVQTDRYPLEKEQELLTKVKEGNLKESSALLNDLLGYVFLSAGNNLATVKYRSVELCSLLSRAAIENGAASSHIFSINNQFMEHVDTYRSTTELCYAMIEILTSFMDCMFPPTMENSRIVREAMNYISTHFAENITLQDVAEHLHLNQSYFSRIFKRSSGSTFKEYLTMVRVEEAKRLLNNTDDSLLDIAIGVGFDNQSYFTSVFKKLTGLTPGQYRK